MTKQVKCDKKEILRKISFGRNADRGVPLGFITQGKGLRLEMKKKEHPTTLGVSRFQLLFLTSFP